MNARKAKKGILMKKPKTKKKRSTWSDVVDLVKKKHNIKDRVLPIPFGDKQ